MSRCCIVPNCIGHEKRSRFNLPKHNDRRLKWLKAIREVYPNLKVKREFRVCEKHFRSTDFTTSSPDSKESQLTRKRLKHKAVPNFHEPKLYPALKMANAVETSSSSETMNHNLKVDENCTHVCRACLKKLGAKESFCDVFQRWAPPWDGMQPTIAEDITKLTNVKISKTDKHSHIICYACYVKLLQACQFIKCVQLSDLQIQQKMWPGPIQVDKQGVMDIDVPRIKEELLSDEENAANDCEPSQSSIVQTDLENMEIKIEPEEFVQPSVSAVKGETSLDPELRNSDLPNSELMNTQWIKEEPPSEEEEVTPDLPLDCILCSKTFHSVQGLKAHVIAHHSYKSVKRKTSSSPQKKKSTDRHQCGTCRRIFYTPTDLMVHETCHNKHACFACNLKFDSFNLLTKHRKRCKAVVNKGIQKHKTLEDVIRPVNNILQESLNESLESSPFANVKLETLVSSKITDSCTEKSEAEITLNNTQNGLVDENIRSAEINQIIENENLNKDQPEPIDDRNDAVDIQIDVEMKYPDTEKVILDNKIVETVPNCVDKTESINENSLNDFNEVENENNRDRVNVEVDAVMTPLENSEEEIGADSQFSEESATSIGIKISRIESVLNSMEVESDNIPNSVKSTDNLNLESDKDISAKTADNMHLHLEILANSDSGTDVLQDSELPVDSLKSDDCT